MKRFRLSSFLILSILLIYSTNLLSAIKAVQISYIRCKNFKELDKEFSKIKANGYNTVIFRVFNNKGDRIYPFIPKNKILSRSGVYFKTKYCPIVYNILPAIIKLCHKHNLKIVAWLTTRYLDFGKIKLNRRVFKYDFDKNKIVPSKGLSFFNEKNIHFIINIYKDLIKNNIDGILLQDDLKILADEDFNKNAIKKFYRKTGILLSNKNIKSFLYGNVSKRYLIFRNKNLDKWNQFKSEQIDYFLTKLISACRKKNINFFMNINYEALYRPELSMLWYSYNLKSLKSIPITYFTVMLYQKQISKELKLNNKQTFEFIAKLIKNYHHFSNGKKIIFKIQVFDWYTNKLIKKNSIKKLFTFFAKNNIENIAIFPYQKGLTILK